MMSGCMECRITTYLKFQFSIVYPLQFQCTTLKVSWTWWDRGAVHLLDSGARCSSSRFTIRPFPVTIKSSPHWTSLRIVRKFKSISPPLVSLHIYGWMDIYTPYCAAHHPVVSSSAIFPQQKLLHYTYSCYPLLIQKYCLVEQKGGGRHSQSAISDVVMQNKW